MSHEQASNPGSHQPPTLDLIQIVSVQHLKALGEEMKKGAMELEDQSKYSKTEEELIKTMGKLTMEDHRQLIAMQSRKLILLGDTIFNLVMSKSELGKQFHLSVSQCCTKFKNGTLVEIQPPIGPPEDKKIKPILDTFFSSWEKVYVPSVMFIVTHYVGEG